MKEYRQVFKMIALITQVGITMLSSVFVCGLIGYWIDNRFETHSFIVFLILGVAGGYRAVYSLIRQFVSASNESKVCPHELDDCCEGQVPRSLEQFGSDTPLPAAECLTEKKENQEHDETESHR